jgi:PIN domain nuclease of toxin-antitoxin system
VWWLSDDRRLSKSARTAIADPETPVHVSAVSAWEIAIKRALGRLSAPEDLTEQMEAAGFIELPVSVADGLLAGSLPRLHGDPFDRMLVAQAQRRGLTVVTRDQSFARYGVAILKA